MFWVERLRATRTGFLPLKLDLYLQWFAVGSGLGYFHSGASFDFDSFVAPLSPPHSLGGS